MKSFVRFGNVQILSRGKSGCLVICICCSGSGAVDPIIVFQRRVATLINVRGVNMKSFTRCTPLLHRMRAISSSSIEPCP